MRHRNPQSEDPIVMDHYLRSKAHARYHGSPDNEHSLYRLPDGRAVTVSWGHWEVKEGSGYPARTGSSVVDLRDWIENEPARRDMAQRYENERQERERRDKAESKQRDRIRAFADKVVAGMRTVYGDDNVRLEEEYPGQPFRRWNVRVRTGEGGAYHTALTIDPSTGEYQGSGIQGKSPSALFKYLLKYGDWEEPAGEKRKNPSARSDHYTAGWKAGAKLREAGGGKYRHWSPSAVEQDLDFGKAASYERSTGSRDSYVRHDWIEGFKDGFYEERREFGAVPWKPGGRYRREDAVFLSPSLTKVRQWIEAHPDHPAGGEEGLVPYYRGEMRDTMRERNPEWESAIEYTETARTEQEAEEILHGLRIQDGYRGGRILPPSSSKPGWRVQALFEDEPSAGPLGVEIMEGTRRVTVPSGLWGRMENPVVRNPESSAAAKYEEFHGRPSREVIEIEEEIHVHDNLAVLGDLVEMKVATLWGKDVTIGFEDSAVLLCSNEEGTQLYIEGGDQSVDLAAMGLQGPELEKESVALGVLYELTYRTEKHFHKFEPIDYYHELGEESGYKPVLIYDRVNQRLLVSGGAYEIKPEGIVN